MVYYLRRTPRLVRTGDRGRGVSIGQGFIYLSGTVRNYA